MSARKISFGFRSGSDTMRKTMEGILNIVAAVLGAGGLVVTLINYFFLRKETYIGLLKEDIDGLNNRISVLRLERDTERTECAKKIAELNEALDTYIKDSELRMSQIEAANGKEDHPVWNEVDGFFDYINLHFANELAPKFGKSWSKIVGKRVSSLWGEEVANRLLSLPVGQALNHFSFHPDSKERYTIYKTLTNNDKFFSIKNAPRGSVIYRLDALKEPLDAQCAH